MSLKLYEISNKYLAILNNMYDEETGVVDETALKALNEIEDSFETKAITIGKVFKNLFSLASAIENERKAMQKRENMLKKKIENLKDYLKINMEKCSISKIESHFFNISLRQNPCSVNVIDESKIPKKYFKIKKEVDITKIKDDLKNCVVIKGAELINTKSVLIK